MALAVPSNAGFISVDTSVGKTFQLPLSTQLIGRVITFKDSTGNAASGAIQIQTQGSDKFQNGTTLYIISEAFGSATFVSRSGYWVVQQGNTQVIASSIRATNITATDTTTSYLISSSSIYTDNAFVKNNIIVEDGALAVQNLTGASPYTAVFATSNLDVDVVYGINAAIKWEQIARSNAFNNMSFVYGQGPEILTLDGKNGRIGVSVKTPQFNLDVSGNAFASTMYTTNLNLLDINSPTYNSLTTSSGVLLLNGSPITGGGGTGGGITTAQLVSTTFGIQQIGYVSTSQLVSTTTGILNFGFVSTPQLVSTTDGMITAVIELINNLGSLGYISSTQLFSTVEGLGSSGYLSSGGQGYFSTLYVNMLPQNAPYWDSRTFIAGTDPEPNPLALDVFGSARILKNLYVGSTTTILGTSGIKTDQVSSQQVLTSSIWLFNPLLNQSYSLVPSGTNLLYNGSPVVITGGTNPQIVSTTYFTTQLTSTVGGLANAGYISSTQLLSTVTGLGSAGYISSASLRSTVGGLGQTYVSTLSTFSSLIGRTFTTSNATISTLFASNATMSNLVVSTITFDTGDGFIDFPDIRALSLSTFLINTSTINVGGAISAQTLFVSSIVGPSILNTSNLVSTTAGITTGYQTAGFLSSPNLLSTVSGLGSSGYVSTLSLVSTNQGITSNYSTFLSTTLATYSFPYSGETLYLNYSISVPPYQELGIQNILGTSTSNVFTVSPNSSNNFVVGFQSDWYMPLFIATGLWTVSLFSQANGTNVSVYASLYTRNPNTTAETLVATSSNSPFIVPTTKVSLDLTMDVPYTNITLGDTLVIKIFANNSGGSSKDLTTYYENGNYSHVQTTLGTGAVLNTSLASTLIGLGTFGYVSTLSLVSTTRALQTSGFLSSPNLLSTVGGLGSIGYISSATLVSTTAGLERYISSFIDPQELASSALQFISSTYFTNQLTSTVTGLGSIGYISSASLISTTAGLERYISSFIDPQELASSALQFISSTYFTNQLTSTVGGLGTAGYISSASLISTTGGLERYISSFIDPQELASSVLQFISSTYLLNQLTSTVGGLGTAGYISSASLTSSFISTTNFINQSFSSFSTAFGPGGGVQSSNLLSTVTGLGSIGYISSASLTSSFISTTNFISQTISSFSTAFGPGGGVTAANLTSTTRGLGTLGYLSSFPALLSTSMFLTSSVLASTITTSSLQVNSLIIGTGTGWVNLGPLQTVAISSIQDNTNALYANTSYFGTTSSATALQFYGLLGNYNNTVLAEVSTGAGFQELLMFKGSSSSDRVRVQTTGNFVIETGVSARLWSNTTVPTIANATPAFIINSSSNVGIQTASPGAALDVAGIGRFQQVSTQNINLSTINGQLFGAPINSTVIGLGSSGYISTASLTSSFISTTNFINQSFSSFSTAFGPGGGINTAQLTSTVGGLGSIGFISTASLVSTTLALQTAGFLSSPNLLSTVTGLGSIGYISSASLTSSFISTTNFINQSFSSFSTAFAPAFTSNLVSTVTGLGSIGYISTFSLTSTVAGLGSAGYISSFNAFTMSTSRLNTSTLIFIDVNTQAQQQLLVSSGVLTLNGGAVGGGATSGGGLTVSEYVVAGKLAADQTLTADTDNNIQFVVDFDPQNWYNASTYFFTPNLGGYYLVSYQVWFSRQDTTDNQLNIQIQKNSTDSYTITQSGQNINTGISLNATKIIYMNGSTDNLRFRAYVGNTSNTTVKAQQGNASGTGTFFTATLLTNGSSGTPLFSTVTGLGSIGYVSTSFLNATISSNLTSTVAGLGSIGYISSPSFTSSFISTTNFINQSFSSFSTAFGPGGGVQLSNLTSTVTGLGSIGYISSASLLSTTNFINQSFSSFSTAFASALTSNLFSTVTGLGSIGYVSTATLNVALASTVRGIGTGGLTTLPSTISTFSLLTSSIFASTTTTTILSTQQIFTSSIIGNVSQFATLSSYAIYVSSFYTATRQATPMFVTF